MALLFAVAAWVGSGYVQFVIASGGKPRFYQVELAPAVMSACDRGYVNPDLATVPELKRFLDLELDTFACGSLPADVATIPLSPMQRAFQYQEFAIASTWRWSGVSWTGLALLCGLLFAITSVAAYGLFRTVAGRLLATLGAVALIGSTLQLIHLPNLRDYSKAPFLVGAACALVWAARTAFSPRPLVALGAGYGALIGLGMGFRNDLLIALPPFVATVFFFLPGRLRDGLSVKLAAVAACLLSFWVTMAPMRAIYAPGGGNSMPHVLLLGLGDSFNADLGVTNDGMYSWGNTFTDEYVHVQTSSYATRMWAATHTLQLYGPEYDRAASELLATIVAEFPADMLVRVYAAVLRTLALPYSTNSREPPTWVTDRDLVRGYTARDRVLRLLGPVWPILIAAALLGLAASSPRLAIFFVLMVFYFAGYPVLQFNERHFFHLEVIAWWVLLLVAQQLVSVLAAVRMHTLLSWHRAWRERSWIKPVRRAAVATIVLVVLIAVPLAALRRYQAYAVNTRLSSYLQLAKEQLQWTGASGSEEVVRMVAPATPSEIGHSGAVQSGLIVAEFAEGACDTLKFDMTLHYAASSHVYDFSRSIRVEPPLEAGGIRRIFVPVFAHPFPSAGMDGVFALSAIDVPAASATCLTGLYRARTVAGLPVLMDVNLPNRWQEVTPYHTIAGLEHRQSGETSPELYTFPRGLEVGRSMITQEVVRITDADIDARSPTLAVTPSSWQVSGAGGIGGRGPFLYLAEMKPRDTRAGDIVLARGRLEKGGLSLGLVENGKWVVQVPVVTPGEFVVVIRAPRDGRYSLILANNVTGWSLDNRLTIDVLGWARGT